MEPSSAVLLLTLHPPLANFVRRVFPGVLPVGVNAVNIIADEPGTPPPPPPPPAA